VRIFVASIVIIVNFVSFYLCANLLLLLFCFVLCTHVCHIVMYRWTPLGLKEDNRRTDLEYLHCNSLNLMIKTLYRIA